MASFFSEQKGYILYTLCSQYMYFCIIIFIITLNDPVDFSGIVCMVSTLVTECVTKIYLMSIIFNSILIYF